MDNEESEETVNHDVYEMNWEIDMTHSQTTQCAACDLDNRPIHVTVSSALNI